MSAHPARQLAQTLCDTTEQVLLPIIPDWIRAQSGTGLQARLRTRPLVRVGAGRATHHQVDLGSGKHWITFGAKMVADKLAPELCGSWLSTREILARGYFQRQVSVANLLAHTGCHEFAHFLQTISGARLRGSVHNPAFYRILDDLHHSGTAERFRSGLLDLARARGQALATVPVTMPNPQADLAQFQPGDRVRFGRDNRLQGQVTRINRKTCSVQGTGPCQGLRYRVSPQALAHAPPSVLEPGDDGNRRSVSG